MANFITDWDQDYSLADSVSLATAQAYFEVKESFYYYKQFNNPSRRRDFAANFIEVTLKFLVLTSEELSSLYNIYVRPQRKRCRSDVSLQGYERMWSRFGEFFDETALSNSSNAKAAYRKAAMVIHPDRGGNNQDMGALNRIFSEVFDRLLQKELIAAFEPTFERSAEFGETQNTESSFTCGPKNEGFWPGSILQYPRSPAELDLLLRTELLLAAKDIFQEDLYMQTALGLRFYHKWAIKDDEGWDAFRKADACERVANIILSAIEGACESGHSDIVAALQDLGSQWIAAAIDGRIKCGRMSATISETRKRVREIENEAALNGRFPFVNLWREENLRDLASRMKHPRSRSDDRFQLNHILQAENAFRRGLITPARYKTVIERLTNKQQFLQKVGNEVRAHSRKKGFMKLEHDPVEAEKRVSVRFVPEHDAKLAFGNWQFGSEQAHRDYGDAYYRSDSVDGKLKYLRQRLWILLSSLVGSPENWDRNRIQQASAELRLLEKTARAAKEGLTDKHASDLLEFLTSLANEPDPALSERLNILNDFACKDFRGVLSEDFWSSVKFAVRRPKTSNGSPLDYVLPSLAYYDAAMRPIVELRAIAKRGFWTDPLHEVQQADLNYYDKHMRAHYEKIQLASRIEQPAKRVEKLFPLVREAIERKVPLNAAAEWQLGYHMDRLTGAMTRIRQFREAVTALEEYFSLPREYRRRSASSRDKALRDRLDRCQRDSSKSSVCVKQPLA